MTRRFQMLAVILGLMLALNGCTTIASYDQVAYQQATSLKVDALHLMDDATEPFAGHARVATELMVRVEKAYEYEKGRPLNEISTEMWAKLKDPNGHLLGGFVKRWKTSGPLGTAFVTESKAAVEEAFDKIIQLESGKNR